MSNMTSHQYKALVFGTYQTRYTSTKCILENKLAMTGEQTA